MISSISLQNFRGFRDCGPIKLARLTFFVGPNSSGKSTIANALMFVAQSFNSREATRFSPDWMGRLVDLGSFEDTIYRHLMKNPMSIEIGINIPIVEKISGGSTSPSPEILWRWEIRKTAAKNDGAQFMSGKVTGLTIKDLISNAEINISTNSLHHIIKFNGEEVRMRADESLSAGQYLITTAIKHVIAKAPIELKYSKAGYRRLLDAYSSNTVTRFMHGLERVTSARSGPKRWVAKETSSAVNPSGSSLLNDPYTMNLGVANNRHRRPNNSETISKYLNEFGIASSLDRVDLSAYHTALKVTDNLTNVRSNLADVGFGASQVIPVIRGCIDNNFGPLVIEQPEIHLHPKAQAQLASLICESSLRRQIFVETHSEHMINRARIMVAEGKLKPENVTIVYVDKDKKGSNVVQIGIDKNGDFTRPWPEGFFDERYHDSMKLLNLKSKTNLAVEVTSSEKNSQKTFHKN